MRIAYLTPSYPPMVNGPAISVQQLAESMARNGHRVLVLATSDREHAYHIYRENITIMRLQSIRNPLSVDQRLILNPRTRITKALKQFRPDVIHVYEPFRMGNFALRYANRAGIPIQVTIHQLPWFMASSLPGLFGSFIEKTLGLYARISLKRYSSLISPTQTIALIIEQKIGLIPNVVSDGVDTKRFHPSPRPELGTAARNRLNLPLEVPLLLHAGRLDEDKSVDKVIRAVAPVLHESDAHFLIVGDGGQKNRLIRLCGELGVDRRVHFAGVVLPQVMPDVYRAADIFVTASEIETQGTVLLEAAASGLPIVAVNAVCISEIVHDQFNGFLVEPGDFKSFGRAVLTLIDHPKRSSRMGMNGRILITKQGAQTMGSQYEALYLEMAKQGTIQRVLKKGGKFPQWDSIKN